MCTEYTRLFPVAIDEIAQQNSTAKQECWWFALALCGSIACSGLPEARGVFMWTL